jgi:hypothetical protein
VTLVPVVPDTLVWAGGARVRWAREGEVLWLRLNEVSTQTRIYKHTLDRFFRHEFRAWRPRWGDFTVEILVELLPGLPRVDLDNVAKAVLDGIKGALFFDDHQVARLVVERAEGPVEQVTIRVSQRGAPT